MFYESQHSLGADTLKLMTNTDYSFPAHLHNSFEFITLTEGMMEVTVDKQTYILKPGLSCLIFPNQTHALHTPEHSRHIICIFSQKQVHTYEKKVRGKLPSTNLFSPDPFYLQRLCTPEIINDPIAAKGVLYLLCSEFDRNMTYLQSKPDENDLLFRIFQFVEANFNRDCTLATLAEATSYHYVYLSKYFKQITGIAFTEYVNRYRINEACYLLKNSEQTVLETAMECGFDSLRSFNRNFKTIIGSSPSEYRDNGFSSQG